MLWLLAAPLIAARLFLQVTVLAKTAGLQHNEWVENADRWVSGFLEKFEEGCHVMVSPNPSRHDNKSLPFL